ncbi:F-box domain containing protein [Carex littledalei]|uniref:F-box domain containing protein n=1 Tax=Carex littledalei TaxID=544730 RepID=A0A833RJ31_9POAL|nr:F-box domain containing protein [Carex littledalei]
MARSESKSSRSLGNRDMVSSLPDSVLHHIMSFMPARQAVQLCVLSKRWKTLWTTLPVLNCCFNELWINLNRLEHSARVKSLAEFVSTVLLLREATSNLHTLMLDCACGDFGLGDMLCTFIRPWIRYAIKRNLRVLTINTKIYEPIIFPSEIFTCPSLEHVTLSFTGPNDATGSIDSPEIINLPFLERLHFKRVELNQDFMSKLLHGCPVLEDLHVEDGPVEAKGINLNMPSLSEAYIEFVVCSCKKLDVTKSNNILHNLFNVHRLELKGNFFFSQDYLEAEISNCRTFLKLICLSVNHLCLICHFDLLSSLLEHCPNLKKLSLVHLGCPFSFCQEPCKSFEQKKVARFKCEKLETVELKFLVEDRTFYWAVKCLQEAVIGLRNCRIIMTSDAGSSDEE